MPTFYFFIGSTKAKAPKAPKAPKPAVADLFGGDWAMEPLEAMPNVLRTE